MDPKVKARRRETKARSGQAARAGQSPPRRRKTRRLPWFRFRRRSLIKRSKPPPRDQNAKPSSREPKRPARANAQTKKPLQNDDAAPQHSSARDPDHIWSKRRVETPGTKQALVFSELRSTRVIPLNPLRADKSRASRSAPTLPLVPYCSTYPHMHARSMAFLSDPKSN